MKPKPLPRKTAETRAQEVRAIYPESYCVKLDTPIEGNAYIVWPKKGPGPRGAEHCAIGIGVTARAAWGSVDLAALRAAGKGGGK